MGNLYYIYMSCQGSKGDGSNWAVKEMDRTWQTIMARGSMFDATFLHSSKLTWLAGKWTRIEDVFPINHKDFPASYVSLPECSLP